MSLRGLWWKGQWHTVTIPALLQRVTSPGQHTSHMDQWHNSCQGPNVLMSHMSQQFYFKLPPLSSPLLSPPPVQPPVPSFLSCTASLSLSTSTLLHLSVYYFSHPYFSVYLSNRLPACLPACLVVTLIMLCINPFAFSLSPCLSLSLAPSLVFSPCLTYAGMGNPSQSCCGSCPLHVVWGWTFEEPFRHLSLSPAFSLNIAANTVSAAGTLAPAAEWNEKRNLFMITYTHTHICKHARATADIFWTDLHLFVYNTCSLWSSPHVRSHLFLKIP